MYSAINCLTDYIPINNLDIVQWIGVSEHIPDGKCTPAMALIIQWILNGLCQLEYSWWRHQMGTFPGYWPCVRGSHGPRWIPLTTASDAEIWCFLRSVPVETVKYTIETLVIWDAIVAHCDGIVMNFQCNIHISMDVLSVACLSNVKCSLSVFQFSHWHH